MEEKMRVLACENRYGKKQKMLYGALLAFFAALFIALAAWQFAVKGIWVAGALAAAVTMTFATAFFFARCVSDRKREKTPALRLSGSELFIYKNGWTCVPLALIEEIDVKKRGNGERVVVSIGKDVYETRALENARSAAEEIVRSAKAAREKQED